MRLSFAENRRNILRFLASASHVPTYTVTWLNWDGSYLEVDMTAAEGSIPSYDSPTPTKPATVSHRYEFAGWSPALSIINANATYTAVFNEIPIVYTVTWVNWDGTVLETDKNVLGGSNPEYNSATPAREGFEFIGWDQELSSVTKDITYKAVFRNTQPLTVQYLSRTMEVYESVVDVPVSKYSVTFQNWDGTVLQYEEELPAGTKPTYKGATPTRPAAVDRTYEFEKWSPEISVLTKDTVYTAVFKEIPITFTATFKLAQEDGDTVLQETSGNAYGSKPSYVGETPTTIRGDESMYRFTGWLPEIGPLYADTVYIAQFKELGSMTVAFLERTIDEYVG